MNTKVCCFDKSIWNKDKDSNTRLAAEAGTSQGNCQKELQTKTL